RQGVRVLLLTVVLYILAGVAFYFQWQHGKVTTEGGGFGTLNEVAGLWCERNLLLQNIIWPRRAHLTVLWPHGNLTVGRNQPDPTILVRAYKWVVADAAAPEGWRGLRWTDQKTFLPSEVVPDNVIPADWTPRDKEEGLTIDDVDLRLDSSETHKELS